MTDTMLYKCRYSDVHLFFRVFFFVEMQVPIYVRINTLLAKPKDILKHFKEHGFTLVKMPEGASYDA